MPSNRLDVLGGWWKAREEKGGGEMRWGGTARFSKPRGTAILGLIN